MRDRLSEFERDGLFFVLGVLVGLFAHFAISVVSARDLGQWEQVSPSIREWYRTLMQPDHPEVSCCGEADAYWADSYEVKESQYVAIVTDTREDGPLGRPHVPPGTRFLIPPEKLKYDQSNPTGHGIVFLSRNGFVYCYLAPGGV